MSSLLLRRARNSEVLRSSASTDRLAYSSSSALIAFTALLCLAMSLSFPSSTLEKGADAFLTVLRAMPSRFGVSGTACELLASSLASPGRSACSVAIRASVVARTPCRDLLDDCSALRYLVFVEAREEEEEEDCCRALCRTDSAIMFWASV